jgi:hypothetical protein
MPHHRNKQENWGKLLKELAQEAHAYAKHLDQVKENKRDDLWRKKQQFVEALQNEVLGDAGGKALSEASSTETIEEKRHLLKTFLDKHEDVLRKRRGYRENSTFWKFIDRVLLKLGLAHWGVHGAKLSGKLHIFAKESVILPLFNAVIEDNRLVAERILKENPKLALMIEKRPSVLESPHTFQRFDLKGLSPLKVACQRRQLEMVKILLPAANQYIQSLKEEEAKHQQEQGQATTPEKTAKALTKAKDQIKITTAAEEREEALKAWKPYETQLNADGKEEIIIPREYNDLINALIDAFISEDFPNGTNTNLPLSEKTETVLTAFRAELLPQDPETLKSLAMKPDSFDPELLLLAAYSAYDKRFDGFQGNQGEHQREHFCVKVIGYIQSILSPETAKVFCEGLDNMERVDAVTLQNYIKQKQQAFEGLQSQATAATQPTVRHR